MSSLEIENFSNSYHSAKIIKIRRNIFCGAISKTLFLSFIHNIMKRALFLLSILTSVTFYSQNFGAINEILEKIEKKHKKMTDASDYSINNKKFVLIEEFSDHSERHILEFGTDNKVTLIELIDDKATGQTYSNIFSGDFIRKRNAISVRANYLEGKQIASPIIYSLYLMNANSMWYLKDINNSKRWIENNKLIKKK